MSNNNDVQMNTERRDEEKEKNSNDEQAQVSIEI